MNSYRGSSGQQLAEARDSSNIIQLLRKVMTSEDTFKFDESETFGWCIVRRILIDAFMVSGTYFLVKKAAPSEDEDEEEDFNLNDLRFKCTSDRTFLLKCFRKIS